MIKRIIGFDTETVKKNNIHKFFCFTAYSEDTNTHLYSEDINDLHKLFCDKNKNSLIFAHNLEFDFGVIQEWLEDNFNVEIRYAKSRLIAIILRRKAISKNELTLRNKPKTLFTLLDSMNFFPMSLAKVGTIVGIKKIEAPQYLGARQYETLEEMRYFKKYAFTDSKIVYKAMKMLNNVVNEKLGITLASTCLRFFRGDFYDYRKEKTKWKILHWMNKDIKFSYFGGRVESFYRGLVSSENFDKINVYDFNSLYPYVMLKDMPDLTKYPLILKDRYIEQALGSALVSVKTNCEYPILPLRSDKLRFKCGKIYGWFTIPELNNMVERDEGKILKVHKSYNWTPMKSPFKDYIYYFYGMRKKLKQENNPQEKVYKLMMNALYGKWGEILEPTSIRKIQTLDDFANAKDIFGEYGIFKKESRFTSHTFFPIASTITAYARLELHNAIHKIVEKRGKEIFYVDTDSLFTDAKLETSNKLGGLKLEYSKDWFIFMRAKAYICESLVKLKGSKRGIKAEEIKKDLNADKDISMEQNRLVRFKESFRRIDRKHLQEEFRLKRFSTESDGKRDYFRRLTPKKLLNTFTPSVPLGYKY